MENLPWTQTEKDNARAKCRLGLRAWRAKKPMLCLHAVTDEDGNPLENEDFIQAEGCVNFEVRFLRPRVEGERHHCHETILRYVRKAPDDISWEIDHKEESAPGPDGIPCGLYRCAGRVGFSILKQRVQTCD